MRGSGKWPWIAGVLIAVVGAILAGQHQTGEQLRTERNLLRGEQRDLERLRAEHLRLVAAQVAPTELENLRSDHAALVRLRGDLEALKDQPALVTTGAGAPPEGKVFPASAWKNAGRATPEATVVTALWAAASGDVNALAGLLVVEGAARTRAEVLLNGLPDAVRAQYVSPEHFVALMFIGKEALPGSMQVVEQAESPEHPEITTLRLRLQNAESPARTTNLVMQRQDDGWKVMVPVSAVERYGNALRETPVAGR